MAYFITLIPSQLLSTITNMFLFLNSSPHHRHPHCSYCKVCHHCRHCRLQFMREITLPRLPLLPPGFSTIPHKGPISSVGVVLHERCADLCIQFFGGGVVVPVLSVVVVANALCSILTQLMDVDNASLEHCFPDTWLDSAWTAAFRFKSSCDLCAASQRAGGLASTAAAGYLENGELLGARFAACQGGWILWCCGDVPLVQCVFYQILN